MGQDRNRLALGVATAIVLLIAAACDTDGGASGPDAAGGADVAAHGDLAGGSDLPAADAPGGGEEAGPDAETAPLAIIGLWADDYGGEHDIDGQRWQMGYGPSASRFHVAHYDNTARWLVARNDEGNQWSPSLWSRFDWTWQADELWYCQSAFDAASEQDALAAPPADAGDPTSSGCGGFAWSRLTPGQGPLVIVGSYTDGFGTAHEITPESWTQRSDGPPAFLATFHIAEHTNGGRHLVARNDEGNEWSPSLWSRFDWTWHEDGLWYCQTVFDAATQEDAAAAPAADASAPGEAGCGGFPWSNLTP